MPLSIMDPLRIFTFAMLLALTVPWSHCRADEAQPVLTWERREPGGTLPRIEAADARLAQLAGKQFGLRVWLRLPADGAILAQQTPDRKSGWRLFVKDAALHFEAVFDWKNARNNRPLELSVPLAAIGAERRARSCCAPPPPTKSERFFDCAARRCSAQNDKMYDAPLPRPSRFCRGRSSAPTPFPSKSAKPALPSGRSCSRAPSPFSSCSSGSR